MTIEFASAIPTLFSRIDIKDPNASTDDLFEDYVEVFGAGSFTLPTKQASPSNQVTLTGTAQTPQFAERGQLQVPLATLLPHSRAHRFLDSKQGTSDLIQLRITVDGSNFGTVEDAYTVASSALRTALIASPKRAAVTGLLAPSQFFEMVLKPSAASVTAAITDVGAVTFAGTAPTAAIAPVGSYIRIGDKGYKVTTAGGTTVEPPDSAVSATIYSIVNVCEVVQPTEDANTEGQWASFKFDPAAPGAITAQNITLRRPKIEWADVACSVLGMDTGDFQSQAAATGNLTLLPTRRMALARASIF